MDQLKPGASITNNKRHIDDIGGDGGSDRKRYKFRHADENVVDDAANSAGAGVGSSSQTHSVANNAVPIAHTNANTDTQWVLTRDVATQTPASLSSDFDDAQQRIDLELKQEIGGANDKNVERVTEMGESVHLAGDPDLHQFSDLNDDCVMEILKRLDSNGLAGIAHTNRFLKACAEDVFTRTHRRHLALNYIDGEEAAFERTVRTFGPLATSMTITDLREDVDFSDNHYLFGDFDVENKHAPLVAVAKHSKINWNIESIELKNINLDLSETETYDQLNILILFAAVERLIIKDCNLMDCDLLFEFLRDKLYEISIDDSVLDFSIVKEYRCLASIKIKYMGEYSEPIAQCHRALIQRFLKENNSIEELVLMCTSFKPELLLDVMSSEWLEALTLHIPVQMDLLALSEIPLLLSLSLFGNQQVNVGPLMEALKDHLSITSVHLNNVKNGSQICAATVFTFEH